jgi:hypothetical protein
MIITAQKKGIGADGVRTPDPAGAGPYRIGGNDVAAAVLGNGDAAERRIRLRNLIGACVSMPCYVALLCVIMLSYVMLINNHAGLRTVLCFVCVAIEALEVDTGNVPRGHAITQAALVQNGVHAHILLRYRKKTKMKRHAFTYHFADVIRGPQIPYPHPAVLVRRDNLHLSARVASQWLAVT